MTTKDMGLWLVSLIIIWIITIGAIFAIIELLVPAIGGLFEVPGDMKIANTDDGQLPNRLKHQSQLGQCGVLHWVGILTG